MVLGEIKLAQTLDANRTDREDIQDNRGEPKMVIYVIYKTCYKAQTYKHVITIEAGVDYAYFNAIFDALIDRGMDFTLDAKMSSGEE
jgi:hypothetical protein